MRLLEQQARTFFLRCRVAPPLTDASNSLRIRFVQTRSLSSSAPPPNNDADAPQRPYYITTPIFYVNAAPHVGHLYSIVLADVLKRWQVLKGDTRAALLTGTDEHGMKVQKAAEKADVEPQALCDKNAEHFLELAKAANVSFDRFMRTTDQDHKAAVERFWRELRRRDYLYESKHEGWYSVSDETFYPESQVHLVLDPGTGRKHHASMETGKEVEWTSEVNYRFRLSAFRDRLLEHYRRNPDFIVPRQRMNFIVNEVESGLADLSVSRPRHRLHWGIPVPDDDTQTIYVWLDALVNYITMAGYPFRKKSPLNELWPPAAQVIGKDIIRFHTIYWPAFLMAINQPLPKAFLSHAHWTLNNTKMSKSLGNVVDPFIAFERYGVDVIRFFMVHDGGIVDDAVYDNKLIATLYKRALQGGLGNLMARVLRSRKWNIREAVQSVEVTAHRDNTDLEIIKQINATARKVDEAMAALNPRLAIRHAMDLVYHTNGYLTSAEPWNLVTNVKRKKELNHVLFVITEAIRVVCILLQPVMPSKMSEALDRLGVAKDKRTFDHARYGQDFTYGELAEPPLNPVEKDRPHDTLFPPLMTEW